MQYAQIKSKQVDFDISRGAEYEDTLHALKDEAEAIALLAKNPRAKVISYECLKLELVRAN